MAERVYHYHWDWNLRASPEVLWPLVADTNRFNQDTGLPPVQHVSASGRLANARRNLQFHRLGVKVAWEEEPFEWVRPHRFGVVRRYTSGPVREMRVLTELTALPGGGTHLVYEVWAYPRGPLGLIAIPAQIGFMSARDFDRAFRRYDQLAAQGRLPLGEGARPRLDAGGRGRLKRGRDLLLERAQAAVLVDRLLAHVERADDLTLNRIRPYVLADYWGVPRRAVLELCLWATRAGLLDLRWDVLCPLCRGDKSTTDSLLGMKPHVHCQTCNIDFDVNFEHLVELSFRPNPAIREVRGEAFCVAGPRVTPHVEVQQLLPPGALREVTPTLGEGRYRLRTLELPGGQFLRVTSGGQAEATLQASARDGWPEFEVPLAPHPTLRLANLTDREQLFLLERMEWSDQAVTAAEVIALQLFRDLFADEILRPGEQISVGSMTILFTDLRDSTRIYREIGDAPAFGLVMDHFDVLRLAAYDENGAIVKTMGDAVMAVFREPAAALRAILAAQARIAASPNAGRPLVLKAGLHHGPCIAVTLNERLDYFGSTVNAAARLQGLSTGGDVVLSDAVRSDPEVGELLADPRLRVESFAATLKGFDPEQFELWRVVPA